MKRLMQSVYVAGALFFAGIFNAQAAELLLWHAYRGAEKTAIEKVAKLYEMKKGVKVTTLAIPYDAYADKISASVPRGKGPDVSSTRRIGSAAGWSLARRSNRSVSISTM